MKLIQCQNSSHFVPPLCCQSIKSKLFIVALLPWLQADARGVSFDVFWPASHSEPLFKNASNLVSFPLPPSGPEGLALTCHLLYEKLNSSSLLAEWGCITPGRWGMAKMAAVSKGMKTVTLGYQSFHSVPRPCRALLCAYHCSHTAVQWDILHMPAWSHVL